MAEETPALDSRALADPVLVVRVSAVGSGEHDGRQVFGGSEDRVGVVEPDDAERVGVRNIGPRWPFGDERCRATAMIVAPQEAQIGGEVVDQLMQQLLRRAVQGRCGDAHQVGCHRSDQLLQAQLSTGDPPAGYRRRNQSVPHYGCRSEMTSA